MADKEIVRLVKKIQSSTKKAVGIYKQEFEGIIASDCHDKKRIECALDGMLDFCFDLKMLALYRKLCRYYFDIDPKATAEYIRAYRDMWDTKEEKNWKRDGKGKR